MPTKEDKEKLLLDWRHHNWHELDESLRVAKEIRDDIKGKPADRLDAIRTIAKMFGALATLRPEPLKQKLLTDPEATDSEADRIRRILDEPIG